MFWFRTMKTLIVLYQRCMAKISYIRLIRFFFVRLWWPNIPKIHKEMEPTITLILYIGLYFLLDCDYLLQYEEGINVFYYLFYVESHIGECNCHSGISVDILGHFNKIAAQYNKFKAGWLVKMITCKNIFLLLLHKCLKRCIYAISVLLLLCDFNFHGGRQKPKCFSEKRTEFAIFISKIALQKFRFYSVFHQNW